MNCRWGWSAGVVVAAGWLNLEEIITRQAEGWVYVLLPAAGIHRLRRGSFCEAARLPFDCLSATGVGRGYHTEYSGMRLLLFLLTEFLHLIWPRC